MKTSNKRYYVERWTVATKDTLGHRLLPFNYEKWPRSLCSLSYNKETLHKWQTLAEARYCLSTVKRNPWTSATIRFVIVHDIT